MSDVRIEWRGVDDMARALRRYRQQVLIAIRMVAQYWGATFETYAKTNARWTDRTGNARQSLYSWVDDLSRDTVVLYLSHGMDYGLYLETEYAERYAIIMPTIERHLPEINRMLREIFS